MTAPATTVVPVAERRASRGLWSDAAARLLRNKPALLGIFFIVVFVGAAILAPVIAPYGPLEGTLANRLEPPSPAHIMGTDLQGRDQYSRILYGAQISLQVGGLLAGAVLTETVFAWPGVGRYVVDAIQNRDYLIIQSSVMIFALIFLVVNLLVDISYAYLNPRIRYS